MARQAVVESSHRRSKITGAGAAGGGVYGAPRVFLDLREAGKTCGKHRVARIMRINNINALRGYKAPRAIAGRPSITAPNRLRLGDGYNLHPHLAELAVPCRRN